MKCFFRRISGMNSMDSSQLCNDTSSRCYENSPKRDYAEQESLNPWDLGLEMIEGFEPRSGLGP